jgi:hypothetical protein
VKLEVEKDAKAGANGTLDKARPGAREQLFADLDPAAGRIERCKQRLCPAHVGEVEGDDDAWLAVPGHLGNPVICMPHALLWSV